MEKSSFFFNVQIVPSSNDDVNISLIYVELYSTF